MLSDDAKPLSPPTPPAVSAHVGTFVKTQSWFPYLSSSMNSSCAFVGRKKTSFDSCSTDVVPTGLDSVPSATNYFKPPLWRRVLFLTQLTVAGARNSQLAARQYYFVIRNAQLSSFVEALLPRSLFWRGQAIQTELPAWQHLCRVLTTMLTCKTALTIATVSRCDDRRPVKIVITNLRLLF